MNTMTGYRDHTLIGLPEQVANVIRNHHTAGTLVSMTAPRPVSPTDARIRVQLRLVDTNPAPVARPVRATSLGAHTLGLVQPRRKRRTRRVVAVTAAGTTVAAGLLAALVYLVGQLVAFIADHAAIIAGLLAVAAVITALLSRNTSGRKRHCPGC